MSNETNVLTDTVGNNENNHMMYNEQHENENGAFHSNGGNQIEAQQEEQQQQEQQQQKDDPSIEDNYDSNEQQTSNKSDLEPESFRKVFIGGLSYKTEDQAFKEYFSKFGEIIDCIIMRDREGRSRGFGFVTYVSSSMVDQLMAARPHILDSREIEPKRAVPREDSGKPEASLTAKKLFVGGIREGTLNEHDLNEYFSKYGNIIDAVIMKTNEGKFRGFGFVEFDDYDPVDKIVLEKHHVIKGNPVNVEKALPKDQTNRARMAAANYGGYSGGGGGGGGGGSMRGPSSRMGGNNGGWGPMGGESNYGGGSGGYRSGGGSGGYGPGGGYNNRPQPYTGGYSSGMGGPNSGGGGGSGGSSGMMGYGGSGPMGGGGSGGGYGMEGPPRGGYDDGFGAFGGQSNFGFGQNYGSSSGGGPMRRGGGGRGGGAPYTRGGGRGGFRGRS